MPKLADTQWRVHTVKTSMGWSWISFPHEAIGPVLNLTASKIDHNREWDARQGWRRFARANNLIQYRFVEGGAK